MNDEAEQLLSRLNSVRLHSLAGDLRANVNVAQRRGFSEIEGDDIGGSLAPQVLLVQGRHFRRTEERDRNLPSRHPFRLRRLSDRADDIFALERPRVLQVINVDAEFIPRHIASRATVSSSFAAGASGVIG